MTSRRERRWGWGVGGGGGLEREREKEGGGADKHRQNGRMRDRCTDKHQSRQKDDKSTHIQADRRTQGLKIDG